MTKISTGPDKRIVWLQRKSGKPVIRSWFDPRVSKKRLEPWQLIESIEITKKVLSDSAVLFGFPKKYFNDLPKGNVSRRGAHWQQQHNGVPVDEAQLVVNLHGDGTPSLIINQLHYGIPARLGARHGLRSEQGSRLIAEKLEILDSDAVSIGEPKLLIYRWRAEPRRSPTRDDERFGPVHDLASDWLRSTAKGRHAPRHGEYFLAWETWLTHKKPYRRWRILVEAKGTGAKARPGRLLQFIPESRFATADAFVFDPNPIVSSGVLTLTWDSSPLDLESQLSDVTLERLDDVTALTGKYVVIKEFEDPAPGAVNPSAAGKFEFHWAVHEFWAVMAYYHIDHVAHFVHTALAIPDAETWQVNVDHAASNNVGYSEFRHNNIAGEDQIALGRGLEPDGTPGRVPDATDADVIVHEYAHFIAYRVNPDLSMFASGLQEGFADFVAAVWFDERRRANASAGHLFLWDAAGGDVFARRYIVGDWLFDGEPYSSSTDGYERGQLWAATMYDLYHDLGGESGDEATRLAARDIVLRLHILALGSIPFTPAILDVAQAIEDENKNETDHGLYSKVIHDAFLQRHVVGMAEKAVDLFIDDGRQGTYVWREVFWDTQDIWARHEAEDYADAAARNAGTGADHQQPVVDSVSMMSVRVKNRGSQVSGDFTVSLYSCDPGIGLEWPDRWTLVASLPSTAVPVGDAPTAGIVVGPFEFTPTNTGHECLLAIIESDEDRAITQDLTGVQIPDAELVRFDNNIAQRNLVPLAAVTDSTMSFVLTNPGDAAADLDIDTEAPAGWAVETDFSHDDRRFDKRAQREVKVSIKRRSESPADGKIHIVGRRDGRVIGGISFDHFR